MVHAQQYRNDLHALAKRYVRYHRYKRTAEFWMSMPDGFPRKAEVKERFEALQKEFFEAAEVLQNRLGYDLVHKILIAALERSRKAENDSHTEHMLADRLGCYYCKHGLDETNLSDDNCFNWCQLFKEAPNLFTPACPRFSRHENDLREAT